MKIFVHLHMKTNKISKKPIVDAAKGSIWILGMLQDAAKPLGNGSVDQHPHIPIS